MPAPVDSGFRPENVVSSADADRVEPTERRAAGKMEQVAQRLGSLVRKAIAKFTRSETGRAGDELADPLRDVLNNLVKTNSIIALQNINPQRPLPVTLQLHAQRSMASLNRLKAIVPKSTCFADGTINLNFIEHYCALSKRANEISPDFYPQATEGKTAALAPYQDFTLAVIYHEIRLIDSILDDIHQNSKPAGISPQARNAMVKVSGLLKRGLYLMPNISRKTLLVDGRNNPNAVFTGATRYLEEVKQLLPGGKLLVPLTFYSLGTVEGSSRGHVVYMLVEKNSNNTVNLHMVNRGGGSELHQVMPGEVVEDGKKPKRESAFSKWNVPIDQDGGFNHRFLFDATMLTLDADVLPNGRGIGSSFRADPNKQLFDNVDKFYDLLAGRIATGQPPPDYQPIYQRPQKGGNCAYSNLKASIRHLLRNPEIYNQIDILKIERMARLTLEYMQHMINKLLQEPDPDIARLKRHCFVAKAAADKLLAKYENALQRIDEDNGVAKSSDSPPHV